MENDSIVFTYAQRFSRIPDDLKAPAEPRPKDWWPTEKPTKNDEKKQQKRKSGLLLEDIDERNKDTQSSDTENASPAIGPKDVSCVSIIISLLFNHYFSS